MKKVMVCAALLLALAAGARADDAAPAESCQRTKLDFGAVRVECLDQGSVWVCEYELGYVCRNEATGEERDGGWAPWLSSICEHLCGAQAAQ